MDCHQLLITRLLGRGYHGLPPTADHLPAGKGAAMEYIRQKLGTPHEHTVAVGDSNNDLLMLSQVPPPSLLLPPPLSLLLLMPCACHCRRRWPAAQHALPLLTPAQCTAACAGRPGDCCWQQQHRCPSLGASCPRGRQGWQGCGGSSAGGVWHPGGAACAGLPGCALPRRRRPCRTVT